MKSRDISAVGAVLISVSNAAVAEEFSDVKFNFEPYIQLGGGIRSDLYEAGGFNTAGIFRNVPDQRPDENLFVNLSAGLADLVQAGPVSLRLEAEAISGGELSLTTGSFPGPPGPVLFFYQGQVETSWSGMVNLWMDFRPVEDMPLTFSVGGGIGFATTSIRTTDFVVTADGESTNVIWSVGAQVAYDFTDYLTGGMQFKYINFGTTTVNLTSVVGGVPSGTYSLANDNSYFGGIFLRVKLQPLIGEVL